MPLLVITGLHLSSLLFLIIFFQLCFSLYTNYTISFPHIFLFHHHFYLWILSSSLNSTHFFSYSSSSFYIFSLFIHLLLILWWNEYNMFSIQDLYLYSHPFLTIMTLKWLKLHNRARSNLLASQYLSKIHKGEILHCDAYFVIFPYPSHPDIWDLYILFLLPYYFNYNSLIIKLFYTWFLLSFSLALLCSSNIRCERIKREIQ